MLFVNKEIILLFVHFLNKSMVRRAGLIYCALFKASINFFYHLSMIVKISYKSYMTLSGFQESFMTLYDC